MLYLRKRQTDRENGGRKREIRGSKVIMVGCNGGKGQIVEEKQRERSRKRGEMEKRDREIEKERKTDRQTRNVWHTRNHQLDKSTSNLHLEDVVKLEGPLLELPI